jgi:hypothetical protein
VDWDWDDNPPRDTPLPRRASDDPEPPADPGRSEPEQQEPAWPDPEPPAREAEPPEPLDESVTQVFSADAAWEQTGEQAPFTSAPQSPPPEFVVPDRTETGRPAPSAEFERPRTRTIEAAERAVVADTRGSADGYERRPRSPQDRAARREQRRRQLRRRRIVALVILIAIVALIVFLIVRGCGGSDAGAAALLLVVDGRFLVAPRRR